VRHLAAFLLFAGFVALGSRVRPAAGAGGVPPGARLFVAYAVAVSLAAVLGQWENWPFSGHAIFADRLPPEPLRERLYTFRVLDAGGRECDVDPAFSAPAVVNSLQSWFLVVFPRLTPAEQGRAAGFLFEKAERFGRREAAGRWPTVLGPLAAPPNWSLYGLARSPGLPCPPPYRALRVYLDSWVAAERLVDRSRMARQLVYEYRPS